MMSSLIEAKRLELERLKKQLTLLEYPKTLALEEAVKVLFYFLGKHGFNFEKEKAELEEKIFSLKKRIERIRFEEEEFRRKVETKRFKDQFKLLTKNFCWMLKA